MTPTRRDFLGTSLKTTAVLALLGTPVSAAGTHPLNILILGGTSFLGPHMIAYALGRGHSVTTFTRGQTVPTVHRRLFDDVERLIGDRAVGLDALRGRSWDVVIDNSGRNVEWTAEAATQLRDRVETYVYTSSTGVYYPYRGDLIGEDTPVLMEVPSGLSEDESGEYRYGVMKARSEAEARRVFGADRTIVVRPTYIMGPGDRTDRFSYWPVRLERGGDVLIPGPGDPVQYIDVRDVSEWMIRLAENRTAGTFNAAGPASGTNMETFVHGAHAAFSSPATFVPIDDYDFLFENRVRYSVPWIPPLGPNYGSARADISLAVQNGLTFRPLAESVYDTYVWWETDAVPEERKQRMTGPRSLMAREADIIEAWRARG
jgi:nucleoside-diphosphate-sugar epimerase